MENGKGAIGSLDDAAALLVQVERDDLSDLKLLGEALHRLSANRSYPADARKIIGLAAKEVARLVAGSTSASAFHKATARIGKFLEEAMAAVEGGARISPKPMQEKDPALVPQSGERQGENEIDSEGDLALLGEFVVESREYLSEAEAGLLALEAKPEDSGTINAIFRCFHTIKGTSAFLDLPQISALAHHGESLLARIRDGETRFTAIEGDLALRCVDKLRDLTQAIQDTLNGAKARDISGVDELMDALARSDRKEAGILDSPPPGESAGPQRLKGQGAAEGGGVAAYGSESFVRVHTERLDRLINMVGELVIAHSMVAQDHTVLLNGSQELSHKVSQVGKIARALHDLGISLRMVPLKPTFLKLTRLVRDLAGKSGKAVDLVIEGEDAEIDRHMVDILSDCLVHILRNAVDHGIEEPNERQGAGKPRFGTILLTARHSGGELAVRVQDDGRGLDLARIFRKAMDSGLVEAGRSPSDGETFDLLFEPGFSTADQVTEISGRGVGLDVVKRGVEALGGRVEVSSQPGQGCVFGLRLPMTLAIMDGMLLKVGDQRYVVPTAKVAMSFCPRPEAIFSVAGQGELATFQGESLPVLRLHRLFNIEGAIDDPSRGVLVIIDGGKRRYVLLVDELLGQQQVVAKSLWGRMPKIAGISSGAILGDGRVGLILDPTGLELLARQLPVPDDSRALSA